MQPVVTAKSGMKKGRDGKREEERKGRCQRRLRSHRQQRPLYPSPAWHLHDTKETEPFSEGGQTSQGSFEHDTCDDKLIKTTRCRGWHKRTGGVWGGERSH